MFSRQFIEKVNSSIDLIKLVEQYTKLKKVGEGIYVGLCPKHKETKPSFTVKVQNGTQSWCCYGCHQGKKSNDPQHYNYGTDAIAFYSWIHDIKNFKTAVIQLCGLYNIPLPDTKDDSYFRNMEIMCQCYESNWVGNSKDYLYKRGLNDDDIKKFRIGIQDNKIVFPLFDAYNHVVGFVKRWIEMPEGRNDKYRMMKNNEYFAKRAYIFNSNNIDYTFNEIRITEGPMDSIMATKYGVKNVVSLLGRSVTDEQITYFKNKNMTPVFVLDGDERGLESIDIYVKQFAKQDIYSKAVILPDGQDLCDFSMKNQNMTEKFIEENAITYAQYMIEPLIRKFDTLINNFRLDNYKDICDIVNKIPTKYERQIIKSLIYNKLGILIP